MVGVDLLVFVVDAKVGLAVVLADGCESSRLYSLSIVRSFLIVVIELE